MIQIDHVTFSYGEETEHTGGVRDIELQIKRGEFACLLYTSPSPRDA